MSRLATTLLLLAALPLAAQEPPPGDARLPINLPTALQLARANPLDIALASQRLEAALAQQQKARTLWLPTVYAGLDYARHDGQLQDVAGNVFGTDKQSLMFGVGPSAVFNLSEAVHGPLAARQVVRSREADVQAAINDSLLAVAEAYFTVQQARGEVAGGLEALADAEKLSTLSTELATDIAPALEASRAKTERARRRQAVESAYERWRVAAADLIRLLRLQPGTLVEPVEPANLQIFLLDPNQGVDNLIALGLTNRPELASRQALVQATLQRLRQERQRPLTPSVLLRGNATNPAGTLAGGSFGGGLGPNLGNFAARNSFDVQVLWEFQNLLLGNRANVRERRAENEQAVLELFRTQDRIAAEVAQAHAQLRSAAARVPEAAEALRLARDTVERSLEGVKQRRRVGEAQIMIVRPAEVVAAIQALAQAHTDYYAGVADQNRAQFRLYRALGQPAQCLEVTIEPAGPPAVAPPASKAEPRATRPKPEPISLPRQPAQPLESDPVKWKAAPP